MWLITQYPGAPVHPGSLSWLPFLCLEGKKSRLVRWSGRATSAGHCIQRIISCQPGKALTTPWHIHNGLCPNLSPGWQRVVAPTLEEEYAGKTQFFALCAKAEDTGADGIFQGRISCHFLHAYQISLSKVGCGQYGTCIKQGLSKL